MYLVTQLTPSVFLLVKSREGTYFEIYEVFAI